MAIITERQEQAQARAARTCKVETVTAGLHYKALSSNGVTWYDVDKDENGELHCSCPARRECYHIRTVKPIEAADSWAVWADTVNGKYAAGHPEMQGRIDSERAKAEEARAAARARIERGKMLDELLWGY